MNERRLALWVLIIVGAFIPGRPAAAQGDRVVRANSTTGSVVAFRGNLHVFGTVRGDATALRGDVIVHRGGRVTRDATALRGRVRLEGGTVGGKIRSYASRGAVVHRRAAHSTSRTVAMAVSGLLLVTLLGFGILAFGSDKVSIVVSTIQEGFGKSLGSGLLGQLAIVPGALAVVVLLAASLIGILLIPLGLVTFIFFVAGVAMLGFIAVATMTGAAIAGRKSRDETPHGAMLRAFLTGTAVYLGLWIVAALFSGIPLLGAMLRSFASAVTFVAVTTGFGAVLRSYWRGQFKSETAAPAA